MVGRKIMDMFMDKLAQRLNAQEIIKANTTAETEELNKLRSRVAEYNECLDKLSTLIESGSAKLEAAETDNAEVMSVAENIQSSVEALKAIAEGIQSSVEALKEDVEWNSGDVETLLKESMAKMDAMQQGVEAIAASSGDAVHKECVKVYRNVQAVVVEEGTKQTEGLELVTTKINSVKGKASAALGISIVTFVLVLCSVAMQVLELLNIKLF